MERREKNGEGLHLGHRERMRNKLLKHGACVFETYELLEMLLYEVVRYRDTNPPAKRLMNRFSSLDGVFSAGVRELTEVDGIGAKTAEYIASVGKADKLIGIKYGAKPSLKYDNFDKAGSLVTNYFSDCHTYKVAMFLFDNSMSLMAVKDIAECDYESAALKPKIFIDLAMEVGAPIAIIAHNHPYGPLAPSRGDRETHRLITCALGAVDIFCLEHYIVAGKNYVGMTDNRSHSFFQRPDFVSFIERRDVRVSNSIPREKDSADALYDNGELFDFLSNVAMVSLSREKSDAVAVNLLERCEDLTKIFSLTVEELTCGFDIPISVAVNFKVIAALFSRRVTDAFNGSTKCTQERITRYFKALYLGYSVETVYVVMLDAKDIYVACEIVAEGTVNTASVLPRRILEASVRNKSSTVIMSHNHPRGGAQPSADDYSMTSAIAFALGNADIELRAHYVIAGVDCKIIIPGEPDDEYDENYGGSLKNEK